MPSTASFPLQVLQSKSSYISVSTADDSEEGYGVTSHSGHWKNKHSDGGMESQTTLLDQETLIPDDLGPLHYQYGLPDTEPFPGSYHWWKKRIIDLHSCAPTGWHFGAWIATFQASCILLINVIILIYTTIKTGGSSSGLVFQGDCNKVDRLAIGIHLVINLLSTLLLGASNYVLQSLSAPTRTEVDKAHERESWLDIGLQSIGNLKYTSRWKRLVWILLSAASIPLHLFYNSSFFSTLSANEYVAYLVQGPDVEHIPKNNGTLELCDISFGCSEGAQVEISNWEFLSASECLQTYAVDFLSDHRNVVVVGNYTNNSGFGILEGFPSSGSSFEWICSKSGAEIIEDISCSSLWRKIDPSHWMINFPSFYQSPNGSLEKLDIFLEVDYCLSEAVVPRCQLQFNLPLLIIVIFFNTVKVICMVIVATKIKDHPLVTIGDAIASFIDNPQPHTKEMCLVSQNHFKHHNKGQHPASESFPIQYNPQRIKWMNIASWQHWTITASLFFCAISIIIGLLVYAIYALSPFGAEGFSSLWQLGFGRAQSETIIGWDLPTQGYDALLVSVLISNSPQIILSVIYLVFNSLCTKLFLALEWSSYAHFRKPLRVSHPRGDQRSTYFLQIPYRFGIPLMAYSALLHWLVSQSIFLVAVTYWDGNDVDTENSIISCGFSPLGMIFTSIVGVSLILSALAVGYFKHLECDMPLAGSCSAAIAAACHPPEDGSNCLKPLKWGVVSCNDDHRDSGEVAAHISFSSGEVTKPVPGCYYA
ncbi:hypothetical protein BT96DRAFT_1019516 [Gymnopus androsaceus JB14]|uniref:DUF6536 domain-containing protein n=1 Tax=Gymnopus androsaceus JB14 TaxID=1447944 RepID=A0A6A4HMV3_9AGAR|nr:hypothetical protein BT96DRAFT_1019516 [Gymnopus androsaceus JB14]